MRFLWKQSLIFIAIVAIAVPFHTEARSRRTPSAKPHIISRSAWGADENWGIVNGEATSKVETTEELKRKPVLTEKQKECMEKAQRYPQDFKTEKSVISTDAIGRKLRWPRRYSQDKDADIIIVHHTGENEAKLIERRTGKERVRAIYKWHTLTNGWGDIGYHYLIDEDGKIYEGRSGGKGVVGAHAYCANVGTIGIALIGNFQRNYPQEAQVKSLRKLLIYLTDLYKIDPVRRIRFQGETTPTITGHRNHGNTQCPGRKLYGLLPAIRALVEQRDTTSNIVPRNMRNIRSSGSQKRTVQEQGFRPVGSIRLTMPPGGAMRFRMRYNATEENIRAGRQIAPVIRGNDSLMLWQQKGNRRIRAAHYVKALEPIARGDHAYFDFTVLSPKKAGYYQLQIGSVRYMLEVRGRRIR